MKYSKYLKLILLTNLFYYVCIQIFEFYNQIAILLEYQIVSETGKLYNPKPHPAP